LQITIENQLSALMRAEESDSEDEDDEEEKK
jgi:hypothetical protein